MFVAKENKAFTMKLSSFSAKQKNYPFYEGSFFGRIDFFHRFFAYWKNINVTLNGGRGGGGGGWVRGGGYGERPQNATWCRGV